MNDAKISAAIIARNEADNIADAVKSVSFADQVVVADTGSIDNTVEIARAAGAEVYDVSFEGFGNTKNKAFELCRGEWIISIDADERVTPQLAENIQRLIGDNPKYDGYLINRLTYFLGKPVRHSGWYPDYLPRLFRRGKGRYSSNLVHEIMKIDGIVETVDGLLLHYSYKNLDQYLDKLNEYSSLSAREMLERGRKFNPLDLVFRPPLVFLKMYIFKAGFLDGLNGFILAVLSSYHVFVKYAKLYRAEESK